MSDRERGYLDLAALICVALFNIVVESAPRWLRLRAFWVKKPLTIPTAITLTDAQSISMLNLTFLFHPLDSGDGSFPRDV
ncbi:uncharacterized protein PHALS_05717 [Plasmopara halstedii]|uniref:Uncharacterized protein n=1 Tax=Plasmopara halstedii TaxID=4781 RepID=A0A0P1B2I6_PLAHL|nr:uncharacterized protein PHALS_05717 [Plasmopara halstedii]CEG48249.1 hypothetical protein PHALS_05717 [Plasmopara halstedii]|eukprot:XP_024584618.1 hypothetical protein PHALS_05717 [Plasmopara halstedii]